MRLTAVFGCVKILAESVASLPLILYKRKSTNGTDQGKERATDHPKYKLLHDQPNSEMTSMVWREVAMNHLTTYGNHYSYKLLEGGELTGLVPFKPDKITVKRAGKELVYIHHKDGGGSDPYMRREVLHIAGLSYDGIMGYSPIAKAREAIGLAFAAEGCAAKLFKDGLRPSGVLTHPDAMGTKAQANLKKSLKERIQGLANIHQPLILEEGMKWQQISIPPEDAQFLQTRKLQIAEIARIYRVPLHMLQELDRSTFSNIEHQALEFVIHTLRPWLVRIEQCYNMQLLTEEERRQGYFFEHLVDGLLRGDIASRYQAYATGRLNGWLSANDVRGLENMNPIGEEGDIYLVPLNTQPAKFFLEGAGQPAQGLPGQEAKNFIDAEWQEVRELPYLTRGVDEKQKNADSFKGLFVDTIQRIVNKDAKALQRTVDRIWGQRLDPHQEFDQWFDSFYREMREYAVRVMAPVNVAFGTSVYGIVGPEVGLADALPEQLEHFLRQYLETFAQRYVGSSRGQIVTLLKELGPEEIADALRQRAAEWLDTRAAKIAEDEIIRQSNAVAMQTYLHGGVRYKAWKTQPGACPFCRGIEKTPPVSIDRTFAGEGDELEGKHKGAAVFMQVTGPKLHPPLHRGCKCFIVPVIGF
jgi:HK97 family phage portal protein